MLLKLDGRYPELFNPETSVNTRERAPSWGVVTADPSTENHMRGWLLNTPSLKEVRFPFFSDCIKLDFSDLNMRDVFWLIQKVYWRFRYCSWVLEAQSRLMGKLDWQDRVPDEVFYVVTAEHMEKALVPMSRPQVLSRDQ